MQSKALERSSNRLWNESIGAQTDFYDPEKCTGKNVRGQAKYLNQVVTHKSVRTSGVKSVIQPV